MSEEGLHTVLNVQHTCKGTIWIKVNLLYFFLYKNCITSLILNFWALVTLALGEVFGTLIGTYYLRTIVC
jgi:hypothetical protein